MPTLSVVAAWLLVTVGGLFMAASLLSGKGQGLSGGLRRAVGAYWSVASSDSRTVCPDKLLTVVNVDMTDAEAPE